MKNNYFDAGRETHIGTGFSITNEEFEDLKSDYRFQYKSKNGNRGAILAKTAGVVLLLLAGVFLIQQVLFPAGPDLDRFLRYVSVGGTLVVLTFGLGLFSRRKNKCRKRPQKDIGDIEPDIFAFDTKSKDESRSGSGSKFGGSDESRSGSGFSSNHKGFGKTHDRKFETLYDEYAYSNSKRWYRSRSEKMLFGVCGGIAERFDVDPVIVRAFFALAFFSYGFSLLIYIILAIVLPKRPVQSLS